MTGVEHESGRFKTTPDPDSTRLLPPTKYANVINNCFLVYYTDGYRILSVFFGGVVKFPIFEPSSAETALGILNGVKEGVSPSDKRLGSQGNWGPWGPSPREKLGTSRLGAVRFWVIFCWDIQTSW